MSVTWAAAVLAEGWVCAVTVVMRPEIELSWRRSVLNGIEPVGHPVGEEVEEAYDRGSVLLRAAGPVLETMADRLAGTRYSLLLADPEGRIVERWLDDPRLERTLDSLGVRPGSYGSEEALGTNAIGTALETRAGITVRGEEHFIEPFKEFTCYGHPIVHPVTRRVAGVLDISGAAGDSNPLLAPFLARAVEDIEARLLDHARSSERTLLAAFQGEAGGRGRAVVALGGDVVLTNRAALDLLSPDDYAVLRLLADDLGSARERTLRTTLASGVPVVLRVTGVEGTSDGALCCLDPAEVSLSPVVGVGSSPVQEVAARLVHGAPGTGRTTLARRLAPSAVLLSCADVVLEGEAAWLRRLRGLLSEGAQVCVDGIDLLPDIVAAQLVEMVAAGRRLVMTSAPVEALSGPRATLAAMVVEPAALVPLRERAGEIGALAMSVVHELDPAADVRLVPSVIEALGCRAWPGNFHELRAVMAHVLARRSVGDVTVSDLPEAYRTVVRARSLAGRERAERDAIVQALRQHAGNKARSARDLGISRTTLYARMRALRIAG